MSPHHFSDAILDLYRAAQAHTPLQFPSVMLQSVKRFVDFDKAMFGVISDGGTDHSTPHYVHLKNEATGEFSEWLSLKKHDFLLKQICVTPNVAHTYTAEAVGLVPALQDFVLRNHHRHVMAVAHHYGNRGLHAGLSIRRTDKRWNFTPAEARQLEAITPHVTEAFRINRALFCKSLISQATEAYRGSCVYDDSGLIHFQCDAFTQLVGTMFADFEHFKVPGRLVHGFHHHRLQERHFVFEHKRVGHLNFVQVRTNNPLDVLSAQELRVAQFYGTGLSYKEIADELGIAPSTARRHIEAIYAKLKIRSKADLAFLIHAHVGGNDMQKLLRYLEAVEPAA